MTNRFVDRAAPGLASLKPYQPGKPLTELERELGISGSIKLASNENPLGPSPRVRAVLQAQISDVARYPDGGGYELRQVLAQRHAVDPACITLGNGSNDVLDMVARVFLGVGRESLFSQHAFAVYPLSSLAVGATLQVAPAAEYGHDLAAMRGLISERTAVIWIANPNNPTGTMLDRDEIARLHAGLPQQVLLVLDGAYAEYVDPAVYPSGFDLVEAHDNVVTTRTFSKAYGLAAMRLGWGYCPAPVADALNRLRGPFNINAAALAAGLAALDDPTHIEQSRAHNAQWRDWLVQQIAGLGIGVRNTQANFILLEFADADEAQRAEAAMCAAGVIPRGLEAYGLPAKLRLSVGTEDGNRAAFKALQNFKNGAGA